MFFRIASVTSYLSENEVKNLQNGDVHLAQIPDFEMRIYRERFGAFNEVNDGSFFGIFHALSIERNFFFDRSFPLKTIHGYRKKKQFTDILRGRYSIDNTKLWPFIKLDG